MAEITVFDFQADDINKVPVNLSIYRGKVLLIVNVASHCGFTAQYEGLQKLYDEFKDRGFEILGFPCNQFGRQESGSEQEIMEFCSRKYHVSFPLFSKINVNGKNAHPLYKYLKSSARGFIGTRRIPWNFTKFLVSRDGKILKRFAPVKTPGQLRPSIIKYLSK